MFGFERSILDYNAKRFTAPEYFSICVYCVAQFFGRMRVHLLSGLFENTVSKNRTIDFLYKNRVSARWTKDDWFVRSCHSIVLFGYFYSNHTTVILCVWTCAFFAACSFGGFFYWFSWYVFHQTVLYALFYFVLEFLYKFDELI